MSTTPEDRVQLAGSARIALEVGTDKTLEDYAHQCHQASVQVVRSKLLTPSRVARGTCEGVGSQHSWVVLANDCYDDDAIIVDPTLWSYDESVEGIWVGSYRDGRHRPHGKGNIFEWGRPHPAVGEPLELTPREPWSLDAQDFLDLLGPLDRMGWTTLAHAPVEGWPAGEIIDAMCESGLEAVVPIDIVGMVTDRNPNGLYLAGDDG
jgi:hypothetical protein